jgi:putative ABC transport system ATP-binding protein
MLELRDIVKTYQSGKNVEVRALQGLDLRIADGEMAAIMGPSGCGKSTLLNIIGCLDIPTSGSYALDNMEVSHLSDSQLAELRNRRIGFVFQTFNLLPRTSALSNVELPLLYANGRDSRRRALEALERVGMEHRASHSPSELSGGERQRVAIARALINNPSIILADEPTGNLDSRSSEDIITLLKELNRQEHITVLVVTHESDIAGHAQKVIYLKDGRIVNEETPVSRRRYESPAPEGGSH